jgi:branched-chain amino acid transport system substrate-binding protein
MAILTSIKGKNPQLLFFGGMDAQGGPMAKQMHQLGLNAQLLGGDGLQTAELVKLGGADAEGVVASSPGLALTAMPGGQAFKDKFTARYGAIQTYAPYAYDATQVLVAAMRRADSADPHKYLPAIAATDHQGVTGHLRFDAKGDVAGGSVTIYRVQNDVWQVLETVQSGQ